MKNNFMLPSNSSAPQQSNKGSTLMEINGQKTAYGFVGGINGQSLNAQAMGITLQGQNPKGMSSKAHLNQNIKNGIIHIQNNQQNVPMNKRVFSANRASSMNTSGHPNQHISMQQRRRQQAALNKKDGNYQKMVNKTALSHGSASSAHIGLDHPGHPGVHHLQGSKHFQRNPKN